MDAVSLVQCVFPALTAFCLDHRMGKFNLTHFQDSGARRGCERRPSRQAKGQTEAMRRAGEASDAGYTDVRRNIEQPAPSRRGVLTQALQHFRSNDMGLVLRRDRSAALAT